MKNKRKSISNKISLAFAIIILAVGIVFYFLLPELLNYPPDTINTQFDKEVSKLYYIYQYMIAVGMIISIFTIYFKLSLRKLDKWVNSKNIKEIIEVREICFKYPFKLFVTIEIIPVILVILTLVCTGSHPLILLFKIGILVFSFATLASSLFLIISKNIFYPILEETSVYVKKGDHKIKKTLKINLIFQIFPSILVTALLISLIGYSRLIDEKGDLLYFYYKAEIESLEVDEEKDLLEQLKEHLKGKLISTNDYIFIKQSNGDIKTSNGVQFSKFFTKYMDELAENHNNRVYEAYTIDEQGVIEKIKYRGKEYIVGIHYEVVASSLLIYFLFSSGLLFIFNLIVLRYVIESINNDLEKLAKGMQDILNNSNNIRDNKLPLTSNDIMGEVVEAFNDIQEMTKENIEQLKNNQEIIMERERLASLGQLIGGIAHNLKTPIMSISGATEGLEDLIKEYDESIDDPLVNSQDHHEIANEMQSWIYKIRAHMEYMSDIITTVKGQAVALANEKDVSFSVGELVKRVNILMKHELKNAYIYLNVLMKTDDNLSLSGDVNNLVQVVNNMISNAIQAYNGKKDQNIELEVTKDENNVIFTVRDYAGGLPKEVQEKLFKEMVTTKGKNGTGLGLYMSYSNIKAHFGGDITYETEEGKGTTFNIIIPIERR